MTMASGVRRRQSAGERARTTLAFAFHTRFARIAHGEAAYRLVARSANT